LVTAEEVPTAAPALPAAIAAAATPAFGDGAPGPDWLGRNLYVRRLPPIDMVTGEMPAESHIQSLFSRFGEVERIKVVRDRNTGLPIGIALVLFKDPACARLAMQTINASGIGAVVTMWLPKGVLYAGAGNI
jgi:RNA recognition motif-containing protein